MKVSRYTTRCFVWNTELNGNLKRVALACRAIRKPLKCGGWSDVCIALVHLLRRCQLLTEYYSVTPHSAPWTHLFGTYDYIRTYMLVYSFITQYMLCCCAAPTCGNANQQRWPFHETATRFQQYLDAQWNVSDTNHANYSLYRPVFLVGSSRSFAVEEDGRNVWAKKRICLWHVVLYISTYIFNICVYISS